MLENVKTRWRERKKVRCWSGKGFSFPRQYKASVLLKYLTDMCSDFGWHPQSTGASTQQLLLLWLDCSEVASGSLMPELVWVRHTSPYAFLHSLLWQKWDVTKKKKKKKGWGVRSCVFGIWFICWVGGKSGLDRDWEQNKNLETKGNPIFGGDSGNVFVFLSPQSTQHWHKHFQGQNDRLTSLQFTEMDKASSRFFSCLFKEQPVWTPYFISATGQLLESTWLMWSHLSGCHALLMKRYFMVSVLGSVSILTSYNI